MHTKDERVRRDVTHSMSGATPVPHQQRSASFFDHPKSDFLYQVCPSVPHHPPDVSDAKIQFAINAKSSVQLAPNANANANAIACFFAYRQPQNAKVADEKELKNSKTLVDAASKKKIGNRKK